MQVQYKHHKVPEPPPDPTSTWQKHYNVSEVPHGYYPIQFIMAARKDGEKFILLHDLENQLMVDDEADWGWYQGGGPSILQYTWKYRRFLEAFAANRLRYHKVPKGIANKPVNSYGYTTNYALCNTTMQPITYLWR